VSVVVGSCRARGFLPLQTGLMTCKGPRMLRAVWWWTERKGSGEIGVCCSPRGLLRAGWGLCRRMGCELRDKHGFMLGGAAPDACLSDPL
jgi:hypothetical protein